MWGGARPAPHHWLFASSPLVGLPPPPRHPRRRLPLRAARASRSSSRVLAGAGSSRYQPRRPRLVAAQVQSLPPPLAASVTRRDAETGLAFLLFVLAVTAILWSLTFLISILAHELISVTGHLHISSTQSYSAVGNCCS